MGFGYLFIGCFFLIFFPLSRIDLLPNLAVIGCLLMFAGLKRLIFYCGDNRGFKRALPSLIALLAVSVISLGFDIAKMCGVLPDKLDIYIDPTVNAVYALVSCLFIFMLFGGIYKLSKQVGLPALAKRTAWMMAVTAVYSVSEITSFVCSLTMQFVETPSDGFIALTGYLGLFSFLLAYLTTFLNLALIFTCYIRICLEGDEDMPYREDIFDKIIAWTKRNK